MTAHIPQLDSEELQRRVLKALYPHIDDGGAHTINENKVTRVMQLIQADRAAFADRVLAVVPEKPKQVPGNKLPYINRGYIEGEVNGAIKTIDQVTTAITNLVAEERGEKK